MSVPLYLAWKSGGFQKEERPNAGRVLLAASVMYDDGWSIYMQVGMDARWRRGSLQTLADHMAGLENGNTKVMLCEAGVNPDIAWASHIEARKMIAWARANGEFGRAPF